MLIPHTGGMFADTAMLSRVRHALKNSLCGKMKAMKGNQTAFFLKENWGDYKTLAPNKVGKQVKKHIKRATVFAPTLKAMDHERWKKLLDAAMPYQSCKEGRRTSQSAAPEPAEDGKESLEEIFKDLMFPASASTSTTTPTGRPVPSGSSSSPRASERVNTVAGPLGSSSSPCPH